MGCRDIHSHNVVGEHGKCPGIHGDPPLFVALRSRDIDDLVLRLYVRWFYRAELTDAHARSPQQPQDQIVTWVTRLRVLEHCIDLLRVEVIRYVHRGNRCNKIKPENKVCFDTAQRALAAGYRTCQHCHPQ